MKRWLLCLLAVLMILPLAACRIFIVKDVKTAEDKEFTSEGLTITLNEAFRESEFEGTTLCYEAPKVSFYGQKNTFSVSPELKEMTLNDYADTVYQNNLSRSPKPIATVEGLVTMEYDFHDSEHEKDYSYFTVMLQGSDCFWTIQFACEKSNYEEFRPYFIKWAKTIKLTSETK